jgi:hypothetical protein
VCSSVGCLPPTLFLLGQPLCWWLLRLARYITLRGMASRITTNTIATKLMGPTSTLAFRRRRRIILRIISRIIVLLFRCCRDVRLLFRRRKIGVNRINIFMVALGRRRIILRIISRIISRTIVLSFRCCRDARLLFRRRRIFGRIGVIRFSCTMKNSLRL